MVKTKGEDLHLAKKSQKSCVNERKRLTSCQEVPEILCKRKKKTYILPRSPRNLVQTKEKDLLLAKKSQKSCLRWPTQVDFKSSYKSLNALGFSICKKVRNVMFLWKKLKLNITNTRFELKIVEATRSSRSGRYLQKGRRRRHSFPLIAL